MARTAAREHRIGRETHHFKWDNSLQPAVEIEPGDIVHFDTEEVSAGQLKKGDPAAKLGTLDFDRLYPLGGPVYVKGAEPGDRLEVEILELRPGSWGWAAILPGLGLLASDFPEPYVRYFDLGDRLKMVFPKTHMGKALTFKPWPQQDGPLRTGFKRACLNSGRL